MQAQQVTYEGIPPLPEADRLMANAVMFLVEGDELDAAGVLLPCKLSLSWAEHFPNEGNVFVEITGPRSSFDRLSSRYRNNHYDEEIYNQISDAISAAFPFGLSVWHLAVSLELPEPDPAWRTQVAEIIGGKVAHNQNPFVPANEILYWKTLRFNSEPERRIATALDTVRVLFFPNCVARLTDNTGRGNLIPDFLVCDGGKWGILECDGATYHPSAAKDHTRDRFFRAYGIKVVERYTGKRCMDDALGVVKDFLELLKKNG